MKELLLKRIFILWLKIKKWGLFFYYPFFNFLILFLFPFSAFNPSEASPPRSSCSDIFQSNGSRDVVKGLNKEFNSFKSILLAFTKGLEPNLKNVFQRLTFRTYLEQKFGFRNEEWFLNKFFEIEYFLEKYPDLKKSPFRDFIIKELRTDIHITESVFEEVSHFLNTQFIKSRWSIAKLFQIEQHEGYWRKVLAYENKASIDLSLSEPSGEKSKDWLRLRKKEIQKKSSLDFKDFLNQKFSKGFKEVLSTYLSMDFETALITAKKLYEFLIYERDQMKERGKNTRFISQAIVDLIHTIGYHDPHLKKTIKSQRAKQWILDLENLINRRERFAKELGYGDFKKVLEEFEISQPTGMNSVNDGLMENLELLKNEIGKSPSKDIFFEMKIRQLSLLEAPFRSHVSGIADCSSRVYFSLALHPNYRYFTLTNQKGLSTGNVTIVLGTALFKTERIKVAFVDKIQNVDFKYLPIMLEGIRQSVEEEGYQLAIPKNLGGHDGISNTERMRDFIKEEIELGPEVIEKFQPHLSSDQFKIGLSRAHLGLDLYFVLPKDFSENSENKELNLKPGSITEFWKTEDFHLENYIKEISYLEKGTVTEKNLYFMFILEMIKRGFVSASDFIQHTLQLWFKDNIISFDFKEKIVLEWVRNEIPLSGLFTYFSLKDQKLFIENVLSNTKVFFIFSMDEELIPQKNESIPYLILELKEGKYPQLIDHFMDQLIDKIDPLSLYKEIILKVLDERSLSDLMKVSFLKSIPIVPFPNLVELAHMVKTLEGTLLREDVESKLIDLWIKNFRSNIALGRDLALSLHSIDSVVADFRTKAFSQILETNSPLIKKFPNINAYSTILEQKEKMRVKDLKSSVEIWLKSPNVLFESKYEFLVAHIGLNTKQFDEYSSFLTEVDQVHLQNQLDRESFFSTFRKLALQNGMSEEFFSHGILESFQFSHFFPGAEEFSSSIEPFELQRTPITQLQWALVMGENPSPFINFGKDVPINGKKIKIDPNLPVEMVSYEDFEKFIGELNQLQKQYTYRFPTNSELNFVNRLMIRKSIFPNENLLHHYWFIKNSNNRIQPIARLDRNPLYLYDVWGNVSGWLEQSIENPERKFFFQSTSTNFSSPKESLMDPPTDPRESSERSIDLGLRLVRVLKKQKPF